MIQKSELKRLYLNNHKSYQEIAAFFHCSVNKVRYWMEKHELKARSKSDAAYIKHNPDGDPFVFRKPATLEEAILFGLGMGLYWGEGTKADKNSIRLGNSNPNLIKNFIKFLTTFFNLKKERLKFSLQIFNDGNPQKALQFWKKELKIQDSQLYKTTITQSRGKGTYRIKNFYGVMIVYFHNKKARDLLISKLPM
jgi:hypothetical protein